MIPILATLFAFANLAIALNAGGLELLAAIDGEAPSTPESAAQPSPRDFGNHGCE